jgi:hypothetical protein
VASWGILSSGMALWPSARHYCGTRYNARLQAVDIVGIRAFAVHAKDVSARGFYEKFGFVPSPTDPMHCSFC